MNFVIASELEYYGSDDFKKHYLNEILKICADSRPPVLLLLSPSQIILIQNLFGNHEYKEMFEHVVIGNIILSTFIYAFILGIIFIKNKDKFKQECEEEEANH